MGIFSTIATQKNPTATATPPGGNSTGGGFFGKLAAEKAPQPAPQGYQAKVGAEQKAGVEKIKSSVEQGASNIEKGINTDISKTAPGSGDRLKQLFQGGGNILKGAAEAGFGTIAGAAETALAPATPIISKVTQAVIDQNPLIKAAIDKVSPKIQEISAKHPEAASLTGDILNTLLLGLGGGAAEAPLKEAIAGADIRGAAKGAADIVAAAPDKILETAGNIKDKVLPPAPTPEQAIAEKIAPKPTVKQAQIAQDQGRLVKGETIKKPGIITRGAPDRILTSDKDFKAVQAIKKNIPGAENLSQPELYTATKDFVAKTSESLKPELEKISIAPTDGVPSPVVEKLNTDWETLKKKQIEEAKATEEPNVKKRQKQFESFLQKAKGNNLNDLWDAEKSYDASIPDRIKNATSVSSEEDQALKDEWIQNRRLLSDARNTGANGITDPKIKTAFEEMSSMFDAQRNLRSTAKINLKGTPSKFSQKMSQFPILGKFMKGAAEGVGIGELMH